MQVTDSIADMLTRIRNASSAKHKSVDVPASRIKKCIAQILMDEGFIYGYEVVEGGVQGIIRIKLKFLGSNRSSVIVGLKRVSKPGLRIYYGSKKIPKVMNGLGIAIVSTSKGIMTDKAARRNNVGGEVMAYVW